MKWTRNGLLSALLFSPALAQQMSLCDMYTTALLMNNTASNQYLLITLVVNTALIGNYTQPNHNAVTGILVPGQYMGQNVTLLPYFNGGLLSSNRGEHGSAINFLDDGGAIPLAENKPANGENSNQYKLLTHLYQFFGGVLGCSSYGKDGFPAYQGQSGMYETHKFMDLDPIQIGYFIQEVGLSAASFGVSAQNVTYIGNYLNNTFNERCTPKEPLLPSLAPDFQAICINSACPTATASAVCSSYNKMGGTGVLPATASVTSGPQLSDLAPQLSSIDAGMVTPGAGGNVMSFMTSVITTTSGSMTMTETTVIPIGGAKITSGMETITFNGSVLTTAYTSTIPSSIVSEVMETITTGSMTETTMMPTTEANPALNPPSSVATVITSVITSGSSTFTSLISTSVAETGASSSKNAAPIQTAAVGMIAMVGAAGVIGQML